MRTPVAEFPVMSDHQETAGRSQASRGGQGGRDPEEGQPGHRIGPRQARRGSQAQVRLRAEHPCAGRVHRAQLRIRPPHAHGVRCHAARAWGSHPRQKPVLTGGAVSTRAGVRLDIVDSEVARVTLAAPERRNAQSPAMWDRLAEIGASLPTSIRVVVLRAEGESFSAGLDRSILLGDGSLTLRSLAALDDVTLDQTITRFQDAFTWWSGPEIVSVAAVQGH